MTDNKGKFCPTFSGNKYFLIFRDLKTKMRFGFLLLNKGYLLRYIKYLILLCKQKNRTIKTLRIDDEFLTKEIKDYLLNEKIILRPCIPHEHATLPNIERDNGTIKETILKVLKAKPHFEYKYWGMAFNDIITKMNIFSSVEDPSISPYEEWYGYKYNMNDNPSIPFGSIVIAYIPLKDQTELGGRSIRTFYVGFAPEHKGGILLFNPKTKRTIVRRSFRIMGPVDQPNAKLKYEAPLDDTFDKDEDTFYRHPFGSDLYLDHDPSDYHYTPHVPIVDTSIKLDDDEFYVENIINHKGTGKR